MTLTNKRAKTTHVLPTTHNGSTVTITIDDSRYDAETQLSVSVVRADGQSVADGTISLS